MDTPTHKSAKAGDRAPKPRGIGSALKKLRASEVKIESAKRHIEAAERAIARR